MQIGQRQEFLKLTFRKWSIREREGEIPNRILYNRIIVFINWVDNVNWPP